MMTHPAAWTADLDPGSWDPQVRQLHAYWQAIAPQGHLPGRQHFEPAAIVPLLPSVWLLDVQHEPFRLRYRLAGTAVVEAHRRELTGLWLDEAHPSVAADPAYLERYRFTVSAGKPTWRRGPPHMGHERECRTIENLLLPLARDGRTVDILLCITRLERSIAAYPAAAPARARALT